MTAKPRKTAAKTTEPAPKDDLTRPGKFSLEALIAGRLNLVKSVNVTLDPDSAALAAAMEDEKVGLEMAMSQVEGTTQSRRRLAQKDTRKERIRQIDIDVASLRESLEGTWVEVQFRRLSPLQQDDVNAAGAAARATGEPHGPTQVCATMWEKCAQVRPAESEDEDEWASMSVDEWLQFIEAVGIPQFRAMDKVSYEMSFGRAVTPDFSRRSSQSPPTTPS